MVNILKETTVEVNNESIKNGFILERNESMQNIIQNMNHIHDALMSNTDISEKTMQKMMETIEGNFESSQIDLYGQTVDMEFIRKHGKEIEANKEIWEEVCNFTHSSIKMA